MESEYNIFLLWSTARYREDEIKNVIAADFDIVKAYDISWSQKHFTENLSRFYGKKLPSAKKKLKLCGEGSFLVLVVRDDKPQFHDNGKNLNMSAMKYRLRQLLGDNYLHASDNQAEAEENLYFLLGKSISQVLQGKQDAKPHKLQQDLIGVPTWLDEDKLSKALKTVPETVFDKEHKVILSPDSSKIKRLVNAKKKLFSFKSDMYEISLRGRKETFAIKQS